MNKKRKLVIGITGASGALYAKVLMDKLLKLSSFTEKVAVVMSDNAKIVWEYELGNRESTNYPFEFYSSNDFMAPFASGSAQYDSLIIIPCSAGTMGRIASGVSNDLLTRTADVMLKERRKLILVLRETPLNLIQINNMKTITEAGGIICPATPSFYSKPTSVEQVVETVVNRVLDLLNLESDSYRWND